MPMNIQHHLNEIIKCQKTSSVSLSIVNDNPKAHAVLISRSSSMPRLVQSRSSKKNSNDRRRRSSVPPRKSNGSIEIKLPNSENNMAVFLRALHDFQAADGQLPIVFDNPKLHIKPTQQSLSTFRIMSSLEGMGSYFVPSLPRRTMSSSPCRWDVGACSGNVKNLISMSRPSFGRDLRRENSAASTESTEATNLTSSTAKASRMIDEGLYVLKSSSEPDLYHTKKRPEMNRNNQMPSSNTTSSTATRSKSTLKFLKLNNNSTNKDSSPRKCRWSRHSSDTDLKYPTRSNVDM